MRKFLLVIAAMVVCSTAASARERVLFPRLHAKLTGQSSCTSCQQSPGPVQHAVQWAGQRVEQTGRTIQSFQVPRIGTCATGNCAGR